MGTKNNPGKFDCYEAADPDEPMFVLLARDPMAATLVTLWAAMRTGSVNNVDRVIAIIKTVVMPGYAYQESDEEKITEARLCASAMADWRFKHRPAAVDIDNVRITLFGADYIRFYGGDDKAADQPLLTLSREGAKRLRARLDEALGTQNELQEMMREVEAKMSKRP